jgi:hypothetical protein
MVAARTTGRRPDGGSVSDEATPEKLVELALAADRVLTY